MGALGELTVPQLEALLKKLRGEYREYQRKGLRLDMSRGKPNTEQLNLCQGMLDTISSRLGAVSDSGVDCRNYGLLEGIPEVRKLLADMLQGKGVVVLKDTGRHRPLACLQKIGEILPVPNPLSIVKLTQMTVF